MSKVVIGEAPKIKLRSNRLLVQVEKTVGDTKTDGGIIIPQHVRDSMKGDQASTGIVVGVSKRINIEDPKTELYGEEIHIGDKVVFSKYAGSDIERNGIDYKIMRETDVFGVEEHD